MVYWHRIFMKDLIFLFRSYFLCQRGGTHNDTCYYLHSPFIQRHCGCFKACLWISKPPTLSLFLSFVRFARDFEKNLNETSYLGVVSQNMRSDIAFFASFGYHKELELTKQETSVLWMN